MTVTELHPTPDPDHGQVPPQDLAAEQSVLGACLMSQAAFDEATDLGLRGQHFYRPAHELIWDAIRALQHRREPVDMVTVANELSTRGDLPRAGGHVYLHTLQASTPTVANAGYYARIVRERAVLRGLVTAGTKVVQLGYAADGGSVDEIVNASVAEVSAVADSVHVAKDESLDDIADRALAMIEAGDVVTPTPWGALNHVIGGARPSRFIAVGARPATGKTVFTLQWAVSHARHQRLSGGQVVYATWEMTSERLYQRGLASVSGVSLKAIQKGNLSDGQMKDILDADVDLRGLPLTFVGASGWTPQQFRSRVRQLHRRKPVKFIVIDHIGLGRAERSGRGENRQMEVSEAADVYLALAHEIDATVVVVTQLNRSPSQRQDQHPVLTDIRDTDRIEQNSDIVILLYRDKDNHPEDLWAAVAKHREGEEQSVKLRFDGARSRVEDPDWTPHGALKAVR